MRAGIFRNGAAKRNRTSNLQLRRLMLYPIELWAQNISNGEGGSRTLEPLRVTGTPDPRARPLRDLSNNFKLNIRKEQDSNLRGLAAWTLSRRLDSTTLPSFQKKTVGVRFELTVERNPHNSFQDCRFQPLSHPTKNFILKKAA